MAKVNELYKNFFETKIFTLLNQKGQREQEKLLHYLKIYSNLLSSQNLLKKNHSTRSFYHLKIVVTLTNETAYPGEAHYLKYINTIAREALAKRKIITRIINKNETEDALHVVTKMLMAQNICVLRILKISKSG